jgi:RNA polymerase sigma-54 factor
MELKQQLRPSQQLVMTPQLQHAIKLLQLSHLELVNVIKHEIEINPLLDEDNLKVVVSGQDKKESEQEQENLVKFIWDQYSQYTHLTNGQLEEKEDVSLKNIGIKSPSLEEHLLWQLNLSHMNERQRYIARFIVGNLNEDGYLINSLAEIALQAGVTTDEVREVLVKVQEFDPTGVGARDLKECLLLQLKYLKTNDPLVEKIISEYLPFLEKQDLKGIACALKLPLERIKEAVDVIIQLEPRPGRQYSTETPIYIVPDLYVDRIENEFVIILNEDNFPPLRISNYYIRLMNQNNLSEEVRDFVHNKLRSATWLIKSIYQRQQTLYRVASSIFRFQREFLEKGVDYLHPLVLRDVAGDVGLHESTISRVTTNKYVQTPYGLFELKFFFNAGISSVSGKILAVESIKAKIREIIATENPLRPYSDEKITSILKKKGISIARRTVTKYREAMRVLPSNQRKKLLLRR